MWNSIKARTGNSPAPPEAFGGQVQQLHARFKGKLLNEAPAYAMLVVLTCSRMAAVHHAVVSDSLWARGAPHMEADGVVPMQRNQLVIQQN